MVSSISGNLPLQGFTPQQSGQNRALTADQQQLVTDTLAEFDPESLTEADALSIVETFAEAGVQPGAALAKAMAESGFDARSIGELAGVEGPGKGGPPPIGGQGVVQSLNISEELLSELNELLNDYYGDELSEEEKTSTLSSIQEILQAGVPEDGLIHVTA